MGEEVRKNKGCLIGCLVVIIIVGLVVLWIWSLIKQYEVHKKGELVVQYLDLKYKRQFAVKSGHYIWANKSYEFFIYPKDDPEFTFQVWCGAVGQSITETYLLMQRKRQMITWVEPFLDAITKEHYINAIAGGPRNSPELDTILYDLHSGKMTLDQVLHKYPEKLKASVTCYFGLTITPENKEEVLKKVYNLYKFLKDKGFGQVDLSLDFIDANKFINNSLLETLNQKGVEEVKNIDLENVHYHLGRKIEKIEKYQDFYFADFRKKDKIQK